MFEVRWNQYGSNYEERFTDFDEALQLYNNITGSYCNSCELVVIIKEYTEEY